MHKKRIEGRLIVVPDHKSAGSRFDAIRDWMKTGDTLRDVAIRHGINKSTLANDLQRNGLREIQSYKAKFPRDDSFAHMVFDEPSLSDRTPAEDRYNVYLHEMGII